MQKDNNMSLNFTEDSWCKHSNARYNWNENTFGYQLDEHFGEIPKGLIQDLKLNYTTDVINKIKDVFTGVRFVLAACGTPDVFNAGYKPVDKEETAIRCSLASKKQRIKTLDKFCFELAKMGDSSLDESESTKIQTAEKVKGLIKKHWIRGEEGRPLEPQVKPLLAENTMQDYAKAYAEAQLKGVQTGQLDYDFQNLKNTFSVDMQLFSKALGAEKVKILQNDYNNFNSRYADLQTKLSQKNIPDQELELLKSQVTQLQNEYANFERRCQNHNINLTTGFSILSLQNTIQQIQTTRQQFKELYSLYLNSCQITHVSSLQNSQGLETISKTIRLYDSIMLTISPTSLTKEQFDNLIITDLNNNLNAIRQWQLTLQNQLQSPMQLNYGLPTGPQTTSFGMNKAQQAFTQLNSEYAHVHRQQQYVPTQMNTEPLKAHIPQASIPSNNQNQIYIDGNSGRKYTIDRTGSFEIYKYLT